MSESIADAQRLGAIQALDATTAFDAVIVGGGATGLGIAVDASLRGLRVALIDRGDFGQGTSSRSTKLVHGGVRYLAQGNFSLVYEALRERAALLRNAPHIAQPLSMVMPAYKLWHIPFYGCGLKFYDLLAGGAGIASTRLIGSSRVQALLPGVKTEGLWGGVSFWDGQFDDARLAIALARTAGRNGAVLVNHCECIALVRNGDRIVGIQATDKETGRSVSIRTTCVINATGVHVDDWLNRPPRADRPRLVTPSQGIHLSVDRALLPGTSAVFWPKTSDGRVLFAIPWLGKVIIGTTDTPMPEPLEEPLPLAAEVDYLLAECANFFVRPPSRRDILSAWAGMRPLVNPGDGADVSDTKSISREHYVQVRPDGLVTVTGGKWTTYRSMAQDVLDRCSAVGLIRPCGPCVTAQTRLTGARDSADATPMTAAAGLHSYGSDGEQVQALPGAKTELAPGLSEAMVRFAVRHEYARTVEDVLARRNRLLFLDAALALECANRVAHIIESETNAPPGLDAFKALAANYLAHALPSQ